MTKKQKNKIEDAMFEVDKREADLNLISDLIDKNESIIERRQRKEKVVYNPAIIKAYDLLVEAKKNLEELQQQQKEQNNEFR